MYALEGPAVIATVHGYQTLAAGRWVIVKDGPIAVSRSFPSREEAEGWMADASIAIAIEARNSR